ncbi:UNVERIFIED_CONTAM: hypothetical protein Sradi_0871100 [Sesamum radiatum]|uniref:Uncharacterized protein n=1 Tax=Sesamum radiatum TaxID=300843 RepID=A0AAW2V379_SESRA
MEWLEGSGGLGWRNARPSHTVIKILHHPLKAWWPRPSNSCGCQQWETGRGAVNLVSALRSTMRLLDHHHPARPQLHHLAITTTSS